MAILFEIEHVTNYKYANTVTFDTHRAMFLPRPAAQGRLLNWSAKTSLASKIRWVAMPSPTTSP
jgi:Bacterial transglutaminase-like N-terminal region